MWPVFTVLESFFPLKAMQEGARKKIECLQKHNINIHIWHVSSITYVIYAILSIQKMLQATVINSNLQL